MDRAGLVGSDGPTHHGVFDIAFLRNIPNMTVMAPKDEAELRDMMLTAVAHTDGPTAIRYPRGHGQGLDISGRPTLIEIGRAEVLRQANGSFARVLLLGLGQTVAMCSEAAAVLAERGIECTVVNTRFVKPLDEQLLFRLVDEHALVVTVEDHVLQGGFGSAVLEFMADTGLSLNRMIIRLGIDDFFVEHASQEEQYRSCGFDISAIVARIETAFRLDGLHKRLTAINA